MASRKRFGLLLAVLLTLGSLSAGSALASDDGDEEDTLTLEEAKAEASLICGDDVECLSQCVQSLLSGYACRL